MGGATGSDAPPTRPLIGGWLPYAETAAETSRALNAAALLGWTAAVIRLPKRTQNPERPFPLPDLRQHRLPLTVLLDTALATPTVIEAALTRLPPRPLVLQPSQADRPIPTRLRPRMERLTYGTFRGRLRFGVVTPTALGYLLGLDEVSAEDVRTYTQEAHERPLRALLVWGPGPCPLYGAAPVVHLLRVQCADLPVATPIPEPRGLNPGRPVQRISAQGSPPTPPSQAEKRPFFEPRRRRGPGGLSIVEE